MKGFFVTVAIISMIASSFALEDFKLDLTEPIYRIRNQIDVTRENPPDWSMVPQIISAVLPCLLNDSVMLETSGLLPDLERYLERTNPATFVKEISSMVDWNEVSSKSSIQQDDTLLDDLKAYMATPDFEAIHNHLWNDPEFLDLIQYFHKGGFIYIYDKIVYFYEYMEQKDLVIGIPVPTTTTTEATPPEADARNRRASRTSYSSGAPPFPFQLKSPIINANETCPYLEILNLIQSSKILGVVNIFMYALEEVAGDPAMHVLLLKLGEKQKGDFFKEALELPQMQEFLPLVQRSVLAEQWVQQLNHILHEVTGLTLQNFELFAYVVKVIQYLVWGHPFAAA